MHTVYITHILTGSTYSKEWPLRIILEGVALGMWLAISLSLYSAMHMCPYHGNMYSAIHNKSQGLGTEGGLIYQVTTLKSIMQNNDEMYLSVTALME